MARVTGHRAGLSMTIDVGDLSRPVTVAVGDCVELPLPSYSGSGNAWSAECLFGRDVARVVIMLKPPPTPARPGSGPPEPTLAAERVVVRGLSVGTAHWRLLLGRSFGPRTPTATADVEIIVIAAPASPGDVRG